MIRNMLFLVVALLIGFSGVFVCDSDARVLTLGWDNPDNFGAGFSHYVVYGGDNNTSMTSIDTVSDGNIHTLNAPDTEYYFGMTTIDTDGIESQLSNIILAQSIVAPSVEDPPVEESATTEILTFKLTVTDESGATSTDTVNVVVVHANIPPISDAGNDLTVVIGSDVVLDGSASSDSDNDALTYLWTIKTSPNGSVAALSDNTAVNPGFTADKAGVYTFQLTVNDGVEGSTVDEVQVTAYTPNIAPTANAGADMVVNRNDPVLLDGSASTDPNGDVLTYLWEQVSGTIVKISNPGMSVLTFVAPTK